MNRILIKRRKTRTKKPVRRMTTTEKTVVRVHHYRVSKPMMQMWLEQQYDLSKP